MNPVYDLAITGSGFGGSLLAMVATRLGYRVLLLERSQHPRFAIGESTSPLTNLILEQLALRYNLNFLMPFTTYGRWQKERPEIVCGLKRGFTYYAHQTGQPFINHPDQRQQSQLMVAASPRDEIADTHWLRSDFDSFLVDRAIELGVDYLDHTEVAAIERTADGLWQIFGTTKSAPLHTSARFIFDATGPRGLLHRLLHLPEVELAGFPNTQALFSHFTDVRRCDSMPQFEICVSPPYTPDDAALHHTFHGGWMWVLRFGNGVTSAGFSVTDEVAAELGLPGDRQAAWDRFMARYPTVGSQFQEALPILPLTYAPRLSYRSSRASGQGWAMLPSAAAFIDPLFSTGIPLTLLGIERLGVLLEKGIEVLEEGSEAYGINTLAEVDSTAEYIGASLRSLSNFRVFSAFSMFYFAAASYSEMARRLDKRHLVTRFLAADRSEFRAGMRRSIELMPQVIADPTEHNLAALERQVADAIACLNIAGLADPCKGNWYGVDLQDVVDGASLLEMTPQEMTATISVADWV